MERNCQKTVLLKKLEYLTILVNNLKTEIDWLADQPADCCCSSSTKRKRESDSSEDHHYLTIRSNKRINLTQNELDVIFGKENDEEAANESSEE